MRTPLSLVEIVRSHDPGADVQLLAGGTVLWAAFSDGCAYLWPIRGLERLLRIGDHQTLFSDRFLYGAAAAERGVLL